MQRTTSYHRDSAEFYSDTSYPSEREQLHVLTFQSVPNAFQAFSARCRVVWTEKRLTAIAIKADPLLQ